MLRRLPSKNDANSLHLACEKVADETEGEGLINLFGKRCSGSFLWVS